MSSLLRYGVPSHSPAGRTLISRTFLGVEPSTVTTVTPAALERTRALGAPTVSPTASPTGQQHTRALGAPTVNPTAAPGSLTHARAQGDPAATTGFTLTPNGLTHTRAQGDPTVSPTVSPGGLEHPRAQGDPTASTASNVRLGIALPGTGNVGLVTRPAAAHTPQARTLVSRAFHGTTPAPTPGSLTHTRALGDPTVTPTGPPPTQLAVALQGTQNVNRVARQVPQPPPQEPKQPQPGVFVFVYTAPPIFNVITAGGTNQGYKFEAVPQPAKTTVPASRRVSGAASNTTTLNPDGQVHTRAQGTPTVNPTTSPAGQTRTRAQGAPTVSPTAAPAGLTRTRAQGSPTVNTVTTVTPAGVAHTRAQGAPTVSPTTEPAGLERSRAQGSPQVTRAVARQLGDPAITSAWAPRPTSLERARAQGDPTVHGWVTVTPTGVERDRAQGTPQLSARALPESLTRGRVIGSISINPDALGPASLTHTRAQGAPAVTVVRIARPDGHERTRTQGDPTVHGHQTITTGVLFRDRAQGTPILSGRTTPTALEHTRELGDPDVNPFTLEPTALTRA